MSPQTYTRIEYKHYDFQCEVGNHYLSRSPTQPFRCKRCHRTGCTQHINNYYYCEMCWNALSEEEKQQSINAAKKSLGRVVLIIIILSICMVFIPILLYNLFDSILLMVAAIFIGAGFLIFFFIQMVNIKRRNEEGDSYTSVGQEFVNKLKDQPQMDDKQKRILIITLSILGAVFLIAFIAIAIILMEFNSRWS